MKNVFIPLNLISINFQAASSTTVNTKFIITMNSSLCFCITVMLGLILIFLNKAKSRWFIAVYAIILIALAMLTVVLCLL